ncbi:MAG: clan AA aspartic protease [Cytophagia bacterium]|nr:MAG: clan AA aspartic protease [Runella sp.]TAG23969.1 MAG: clan AA aspartic protease [Cytophagales bacterium]TAG34626.1 MAG: clan AA aspartic protease [Cytophagia bacterium]TAG50597.1 MAG: clan AA aspartic protease [Runella slithyformis]TAG76704.1 MAG: clan AA aspartic protease [Cytophagales bacterium]
MLTLLLFFSKTVNCIVKDAYKLDQEFLRKVTVTALADSGAYYLCINQDIAAQLGVPVIRRKLAELADGTIREFEVVGPIEVRFENRETTVDAMVMPGNSEVLLGAIPMEGMDVLIHPLRQELIVNPAHPYMAQFSLK